MCTSYLQKQQQGLGSPHLTEENGEIAMHCLSTWPHAPKPAPIGTTPNPPSGHPAFLPPGSGEVEGQDTAFCKSAALLIKTVKLSGICKDCFTLKQEAPAHQSQGPSQSFTIAWRSSVPCQGHTWLAPISCLVLYPLFILRKRTGQ